jgi:hypothetical protein
MANVLSKDKQIAIVSALAEGSSIRSIERMTSIHRDTIMRLGVRVGQGCAKLLDVKMRGLDCKRLELDEIWGFIGKKMRHVKEDDDPTFGDVWTYCAIDAETKLVPSYHVASNRSIETTLLTTWLRALIIAFRFQPMRWLLIPKRLSLPLVGKLITRRL